MQESSVGPRDILQHQVYAQQSNLCPQRPHLISGLNCQDLCKEAWLQENLLKRTKWFFKQSSQAYQTGEASCKRPELPVKKITLGLARRVSDLKPYIIHPVALLLVISQKPDIRAAPEVQNELCQYPYGGTQERIWGALEGRREATDVVQLTHVVADLLIHLMGMKQLLGL